MDKPICCNCIYYHKDVLKPSDETGQCRKKPPILIKHGAGAQTMFPNTKHATWCADHPKFVEWSERPKNETG